jgi:hypothetical protein
MTHITTKRLILGVSMIALSSLSLMATIATQVQVPQQTTMSTAPSVTMTQPPQAHTALLNDSLNKGQITPAQYHQINQLANTTFTPQLMAQILSMARKFPNLNPTQHTAPLIQASQRLNATVVKALTAYFQNQNLVFNQQDLLNIIQKVQSLGGLSDAAAQSTINSWGPIISWTITAQ